MLTQTRAQPWERMDKQVNRWTKDGWTGGWMGREGEWPDELKKGQEVCFLWSLNHTPESAPPNWEVTQLYTRPSH